jgi:uncharacterized protein YihD (DUF1040 family)
MRDPNRIPEVINTLQTVWNKFPDLRLGQLIQIALNNAKYNNNDPFYAEDDLMLKGLKKLSKA